MKLFTTILDSLSNLYCFIILGEVCDKIAMNVNYKNIFMHQNVCILNLWYFFNKVFDINLKK